MKDAKRRLLPDSTFPPPLAFGSMDLRTWMRSCSKNELGAASVAGGASGGGVAAGGGAFGGGAAGAGGATAGPMAALRALRAVAASEGLRVGGGRSPFLGLRRTLERSTGGAGEPRAPRRTRQR